MTPNEAAEHIWLIYHHRHSLTTNMRDEAVQIINAAIATATAELRARLAAAEKLIAKWRAKPWEGDRTAGMRDCSDELEQALAAKGAE